MMSLPDYQKIMLPLLAFCSDNNQHSKREALQFIIKHFDLTLEEQQKMLPSGKQTYIDNRVGWARTYLKKAGLLSSPKRGYMQITPKGAEVLKKKPKKIDRKFLLKFDEFKEFISLERKTDKEKPDENSNTPDELIEEGFDQINASLAQDLLGKIRSEHFTFLERLVKDLLSSMGYGEGEVTQASCDEGVDGFVDQDKLGLERIYFQAKRYHENNPVSSSQLRDFIGSLELKGVSKGVFITTSRFHKNADDMISKTSKSIVLIDGVKLARLMIDYDIGVTTEKVYKIKRIDSDFFGEE